MLRNLTEKLRAKLPATTSDYSGVKFVHDIFMMLSQNFSTGSKPSRRSITAAKKIRKGEKGKAQIK